HNLLHCAVALASFTGLAGAQGLGARITPLIPGIDSLAAAEFAKDSLGSITVGVVAGAELVWTHSYGFADMKSRRVADRNTVYRIGSITKPFTAVMLMQLLNEGKIRLSDPVEKYFPEIKQVGGMSPGAPPVTFLQLATMTAGLAREPREEGPFWTGPVARWEQTLISALPHTSYESFPGTRFSYSNVGYAILGAELGRVANESYVNWERARVLEPLGMTRTRFEIDASIAANVAKGYLVTRDGSLDGDTPAKEARDGRGYKVPNGAIFTTVDDLSRFVAFELGHGSASVLPPARLDTAFSGFVASSADMSSGYGLGFMAMRRGAFTYVGHSGAVAGYGAAMYFNRAAQVGVVVFHNVSGGREDPDGLAVDILSRLVDENKQHRVVSVDPKIFDGYVGRYEFRPNLIMAVTREGNQLFTQATGQRRIEVFPEGERDFFVKAFDAQLTFETDARGRATAIILHQGGATLRAKRIE
ncbi:MAG: serine hydrolase, partial [bacterium]